MSDLQIKLSLGKMDMLLQGDGELVYKVFCDIRDNGLGLLSETHFDENEVNVSNTEEDLEIAPEKIDVKGQAPVISQVSSKSKKRSATNNFQLLKDLDLSGNSSNMSLKNFMEEKNPVTNVQKTAAFVYYLQTILAIDGITIDHIFTCYKSMNYRIPNNLQQNLTDTSSSKYGYINRKDGKYSMTIIGTNFIEHDLPKGE